MSEVRNYLNDINKETSFLFNENGYLEKKIIYTNNGQKSKVYFYDEGILVETEYWDHGEYTGDKEINIKEKKIIGGIDPEKEYNSEIESEYEF